MARPKEVAITAKARGRRRLVAVVVSVVILLAVGTVGFLRTQAASEPPGTRMLDQGSLHLPSSEAPHVPYNSDPPTSGPHLAYVAPWGIHTRPIVRELQVHNLEDGGVLVQYSCECPDVVKRLDTIVRRYARHVILAPYPTMKSKIALTAWTRIETLDQVDEARITRFIEAYRGVDHHPAR